MLKRQTVWLLTMLSLMIVLSAYYIMSDKEDLAYIQTEGDISEPLANQDEIDADVEIGEINEIGNNEILTMIRMELEDERSMKKERLRDIVASSNATTAEINDALNEIDEIEKINTKESILQKTILSEHKDFSDVLVRAEKDIVHVHVVTESNLDKQGAIQIMQMVRDELGDIPVDVVHQLSTE